VSSVIFEGLNDVEDKLPGVAHRDALKIITFALDDSFHIGITFVRLPYPAKEKFQETTPLATKTCSEGFALHACRYRDARYSVELMSLRHLGTIR
jgi:hypothetical protein